MPTYRTKEKAVQITGAGPNGDAVGPILFKTGTYTTEDPNEVFVLDNLALEADSIVSFEQKEKGE